jgi:trehalose-6-phosphate synthase
MLFVQILWFLTKRFIVFFSAASGMFCSNELINWLPTNRKVLGSILDKVIEYFQLT